jgi:hypothetical protein
VFGVQPTDTIAGSSPSILVLLPLALAFFAPSAGADTARAWSGQVEVIVELAPPAARAGFGRPGLTARARRARRDRRGAGRVEVAPGGRAGRRSCAGAIASC